MKKKLTSIRLTAKPRDRFIPSKQEGKGQKENSLKDDRKTSFWDGRFAQLLLAPILAASLVTGATLWVQDKIDDRRSNRESTLEDERATTAVRVANLMFVRDRSYDSAEKPYQSMDLEGMNLNKINFRGANLENANLQTTELFHSDFRTIENRVTFLNNASLNGTFGSFVNFDQTVLIGTNINDATLIRSSFRNTVLLATQFQRTCLVGSDFTDAQIIGPDFSGANLLKAKGVTKEMMKSSDYDDRTVWPWDNSDFSFTDVCEKAGPLLLMTGNPIDGSELLNPSDTPAELPHDE